MGFPHIKYIIEQGVWLCWLELELGCRKQLGLEIMLNFGNYKFSRIVVRGW